MLFFLVDTGADLTMLRPRDYGEALGLPLSQAQLGSPVGGIGKPVSTRRAEGMLDLQDDSGRRLVSHITFTIPDSVADQPSLILPVLGRLVVDLPRRVLTLALPLGRSSPARAP